MSVCVCVCVCICVIDEVYGGKEYCLTKNSFRCGFCVCVII